MEIWVIRTIDLKFVVPGIRSREQFKKPSQASEHSPLSYHTRLTMYLRFIRYVAPLVLVSMSIDVSDTILNAGLILSHTNSSSNDNNLTLQSSLPLSPSSSSSSSSSYRQSSNSSQISKLAAFGAAHRVYRFVYSGSWEMRAVGIRLVRHPNNYLPALFFALLMSTASSCVMILLAITPLGNLLTGIQSGTHAGDLLSIALLSLSLLPILKAVDRLHEGLLLQKKQSGWVSAGGVLDMLAQLIVMTIMLNLKNRVGGGGGGGGGGGVNKTNPMVAPIFALYVGVLCKMCWTGYGVCQSWSCRRASADAVEMKIIKMKEEDDNVHLQLQPPGPSRNFQQEEEEEEKEIHDRIPTVTRSNLQWWSFTEQILHLWWPLAWVKMFQGVCRPLMNLLVASGSESVIGVAVLTLCFPLGHMFYAGLNNLKGIASVFMDVPGSLVQIKRFIRASIIISFILGFIFLWSDAKNGIGALRLLTSLGADEHLVERCILPLRIFSFFCFAVGLRNYFTSLAVLHKSTTSLAYSGPARVAVLVLMGWFVLGENGIGHLKGGTLGIAALFSGFITEALTVAIVTTYGCHCCCSRGSRRSRRRSKNSKNSKNSRRSSHERISIDDEEDEDTFFTAPAVGIVELTSPPSTTITTATISAPIPENLEEEEEEEEEKEKEKEDIYEARGVAALFDVRYPWTEQLMNGKKTIETREYPLPSRYLHQTLALYETHVEVKDDQVEDDQVEEDHQRDDCCVGLIQFCSCKEYTSKEQWSKDSDKHGVPFDATPEEFGWVDGIQKYGWKVSYVEKTKKKKLPQRFERHFRSFFTVHQW